VLFFVWKEKEPTSPPFVRAKRAPPKFLVMPTLQLHRLDIEKTDNLHMGKLSVFQCLIFFEIN
jgi:hypothetical protein